MSVAWIAYADFLSSMAVVFLALYLGQKRTVPLELTNPPGTGDSVAVYLGSTELQRGNQMYTLPVANTAADSVKIALRVKGYANDGDPVDGTVWATVRRKDDKVIVDYRARDQVILQLDDSKPNFETGKATLKEDAIDALQSRILLRTGKYGDYSFLRAANGDNSSQMLMVCGYADDQVFIVNGVDRNWQLSFERAQAVRDFLVMNGCDTNRILVAAFGSQQRLNNGTTDADRSQNRRVELRIVQDGRSVGARPENWVR